MLNDAASGSATAADAGYDAERYSFETIQSSGALTGFRPLAELEAGFELGAATKGPSFLGQCQWAGQAGVVVKCADI